MEKANAKSHCKFLKVFILLMSSVGHFSIPELSNKVDKMLRITRNSSTFQIGIGTAFFIHILFFVHFIACSSRDTRAFESTSHHGHPIKRPGQGHHHHHHSEEESESDEDKGPASRPEVLGMKGIASAGMSYLKPAKSSPKCMGQDMRLEKIVQVTDFCEKETGEGKNETETQGRSLCFTACMFKYLGLIGDDLMFTSNIGSVVVDIFPSIAHSLVKKAIRSCAKSSVLPLSKSDNCTSFGPVKGCILRHVQNICNGDY